MLNFPANPVPQQQYNDANGKLWEFDGVKWNIATSSFLKTFFGVKVTYQEDKNLTTTLAPISWDVVDFDTANFFNEAFPTKIKIPRSGYYRIRLVTEIGQEGAGQSYRVVLKRNSQEILNEQIAVFQTGIFEQLLQFNVEDTIEFYASETEGIGRLLPGTFLEVELQGYTFGGAILPGFAFSGVKAELGTDRATTVTPTPISWNQNEMIYNVNADSSGNTYWSSTDSTKFNIYIGGYYKIKAFFQTGTDGSEDSYTFTLLKNGETELETGTLGPEQTAQIEDTYFLLQEDYLELLISNSENIGNIKATNSSFEIIRLGV